MVDRKIEVADLADRQRLNVFHLLTAILCFLILFVDGRDCDCTVLSRLLDKFGPMIAAMAALSRVVAVIYMGTSALSTGATMSAAIAAFSFSSGTHTPLNATIGAFYPTGIRGNSIGYATGMGRIGGIVGPVLTGYLLSARLPLRTMLYPIAAPYGIAAIVFPGLGLCYNHTSSCSASDDTLGIALQQIVCMTTIPFRRPTTVKGKTIWREPHHPIELST